MITPPADANYEAWFRPMEFTLHVISNSPAIMQAAEASFGGFGVTPPTVSPDLTFHLFEHAIDDGELGQPIFRRAGPYVYQTIGRDSTLVANTASGFAYGYFSPTTLANPAFFRWHFLELAFFVMLSPRGLMGVHGAAIVKNNRALLIRAANGGGKSTLAFAAIRRGYQLLAEDVVWLEIGRMPLSALRWWGLPWSFHLLPDAKTLFPELTAYEPVLQTNDELKLEVDVEQLYPGSTTVKAQAGPVVLLERVPGSECRLEQLDLATATDLWLAGIAGSETEHPNYHHYVKNLLTKNAYRLYFGDDIEAGVDLLEQLIAH